MKPLKRVKHITLEFLPSTYLRYGIKRNDLVTRGASLGLLKEFREFAIKGNVIDLAVGLIIGAEFGKIVNSLVQDVIMPPIGFIVGGVDFKNLYWTLKEGNPGAPYPSLIDAQKAGAITINIGTFVTTLMTFMIIAFAVFLLVKAMNRLRPPLPIQQR
jgi:large conductance mechanosensitive channel